MSPGSVLELSEDLVPSPRPTLVSRRVEETREPLIFSTDKAALQGRFIQRDGCTFLWFTFPRAHVLVPVLQPRDPTLFSRIQQILDRRGAIDSDGARVASTAPPTEVAEEDVELAEEALAL